MCCSSGKEEGEFLKRILDKIVERHTYHDGTLVDAQTDDVYGTISKVVEDAKKDFVGVLEHLRSLRVESPYTQSIVKKWFGGE